jgi:DNA-binding NarL/FixJ family response regulator
MIKKILLVNDEKKESLDHILKAFREDENYEILSKVSLDDETVWPHLEETDLVLINRYLPGGKEELDSFKRLRTEKPGLKSTILMVADTDKMKPEEWTECLDLGVKHILNKKDPPQILKMKIDDLIQAEKYSLQVESLKNQLNRGGRNEEYETSHLNKISKLIADTKTWNFMYRVISEEGPIHHKEVNVCLLVILNSLLSRLERKSQKEIKPYPYETLKPNDIDMSTPFAHTKRFHHPPHHRAELNIPLGIPSRFLNTIYGDDNSQLVRTVTHLFEGPPHEVYMNVLFLHILEQFYSLLEE